MIENPKISEDFLEATFMLTIDPKNDVSSHVLNVCLANACAVMELGL